MTNTTNKTNTRTQPSKINNIYYDETTPVKDENRMAFWIGSINQDMAKAILWNTKADEAIVKAGFFNNNISPLDTTEEYIDESRLNGWAKYEEVAIRYTLKVDGDHQDRADWNEDFVKEVNRIKREHACKVSWTNCSITFILEMDNCGMNDGAEIYGIDVNLLREQIAGVLNPIETAEAVEAVEAVEVAVVKEPREVIEDRFYDELHDIVAKNIEVERTAIDMDVDVGGINFVILAQDKPINKVIGNIRDNYGQYFGIDVVKNTLKFTLDNRKTPTINVVYGA